MTEPKKRLRFTRPILYASSAYPPRPGGSCIINRNLLEAFSAESIVLATHRPAAGMPEMDLGGHKPYYVMRDFFQSTRLNLYSRRMLISVAEKKLTKLATDHNCGAIVSAYPNIYIFYAAFKASQKLGLPFIPYLHDTLVEAFVKSPLHSFSGKVQEKIFPKAAKILVMSQGMADLFLEKYDLDAKPMIHTLPEAIPEKPEVVKPDWSAFWGGGIYAINEKALLRVHKAMNRLENLRMFLATDERKKEIVSKGFDPERFSVDYIADRDKYLKTLRSKAFQILALCWEDESSVHSSELSTIFPTKTIEYLISGRPILVHCPDNYFLARFFKENGCGEVVTERSVAAIEAAIKRILTDSSYAEQLTTRAFKTAEMFTLDKVAAQFHAIVESVM